MPASVTRVLFELREVGGEVPEGGVGDALAISEVEDAKIRQQAKRRVRKVDSGKGREVGEERESGLRSSSF